MIGFNNGEFQEVSKICIPITSMAINRGYGAFEFFEIINNTPFYGDRHLRRLQNTLNLLKLKISFENKLMEITQEVIARNKMDDFYLKIFVLPHQIKKENYFDASLYVFPTKMPVYNDLLYKKGARLNLKRFERFLPEAKSTNYLAGQFWNDEIIENDIVDTLYFNGETIQETSRGNIFAVKEGRITTPKFNVLKGITRSIAIDIINSESLDFLEEEIPINDLLNADEVFLSSTTKLIMPIVAIAGNTIANGKPGVITNRLMEEFKRIKAAY